MTTPVQPPTASLHIRPAGPLDQPFVLAQVPRLAAFGPPAWRNPTQMTHVDTLELTRALLAHAEAWARAEGYTTISLSVFAQNTAARALYQKAGFGGDIIRHVKPLVPNAAEEAAR